MLASFIHNSAFPFSEEEPVYGILFRIHLGYRVYLRSYSKIISSDKWRIFSHLSVCVCLYVLVNSYLYCQMSGCGAATRRWTDLVSRDFKVNIIKAFKDRKIAVSSKCKRKHDYPVCQVARSHFILNNFCKLEN